MLDQDKDQGQKHGFVVVGTGAIAAAHVGAIESLPNARLVGVTGGSRAPALAAKHGVRHFADLAAALADEQVTVVSVCTPSGAHLEAAVAAAQAGRHVIVEKPLEVSVGRAQAVVDAADAAGVKLATVFGSRFADGNRRLQRAVRAGELGRLLQGDATVKWFRSQAYYDSGAWRGTWALDGGGALMNQAIHQIDLLLWIMGDVDEVFAYAGTMAHERIEVEDTLVAVLRYRSGALGQVSAATSLWPGQPKGLEVYGERASVTLLDDAVVRWQQHGEDGATRSLLEEDGTGTGVGAAKGATFADPMAMSFENHRRQIEDFLDAIEHDRAPLVDGHEGLRSVALVEAIYRSVREGRPVRVAEG